tara:strand:- start:402 stop:794 length:393 start_codon:yes stop_codon:yes gene_type:complete
VKLREECAVLLKALGENFPTGMSVYIEWLPQIRYWDKAAKKWRHVYADIGRVGRRLRIRMSAYMNRTKRGAQDTLIHEFCHAIDWKTATWENHPANADGERDHPPAFWAQYGEIYEWFYHDGGRERLGLS